MQLECKYISVHSYIVNSYVSQDLSRTHLLGCEAPRRPPESRGRGSVTWTTHSGPCSPQSDTIHVETG